MNCIGCGIEIDDGGFWEPENGVLSETQGIGPYCSQTCGVSEE